MSGLLRRLTRRRPATADENRSLEAGSSEPAAARADAPAEPGGDRPVPAADEQQTHVLPATGEQPAASEQPATEQTSPGAQWATSAPTDQPTAFAAQPAPVRDLPAGVDPGDLASAPPASARRGKLRRRLRYLRHVRELLLRDLGGFTYELHRTAGGTPEEAHRRLSAAKASRISALDEEVGALEARLGEPHAETVLREAGIGGTCPECGELHASDAHFCSRCGAPLDAKARAQREAAIAAAAPVTGSHPTPEPLPASVLWAGGPRPSTKREPEEEEKPAAVTSQWLASRDQPTTYDRAAHPDVPAVEPATPADEPAASPPHEPTTAPAADKVAQSDDAPASDEAAAASDGPATDEPAPASDEPAAATDDPAATGDEPAAATGDEPAAVTDEPAGADDQPAAATDEPAAATDEPAAPAKPKRRPRKAAPKPAPGDPATDSPEAEAGKGFEPGPNGRRDDDVPPPVTSGDPLASRREQAK
jgi:hypothetical protein